MDEFISALKMAVDNYDIYFPEHVYKIKIIYNKKLILIC